MTPDETAARVRAARGYAGFRQAELVERTGIDEARLDRLVAKAKPSRATLEERQAIADACGIPRAFMEDGFDAADGDGQMDTDRLAAIEDTQAFILRFLSNREEAEEEARQAALAAELDRVLGRRSGRPRTPPPPSA